MGNGEWGMGGKREEGSGKRINESKEREQGGKDE
jgi:hypothetical protein